MTYTFKPAEQDDAPLFSTTMLGGGSGTGKTYSALLLARGLADGKPFAVIDTENRRALHHRRTFPEMHHLDLKPDPEQGFGPDVYMQAIEAAEQAGYPVIVIDSFSHAHEGIGGILELHAQKLDQMTGGDASRRDAKSMLAWAAVKPRERRLIDRVIRAQAHVVLCVRAKKQITDPRNGKLLRETKLRRADLPWDLAINRDIIFETTATFLLTPEKPGVPVPIKLADEFRGAFPLDRPIGIEAGRMLAEWSGGSLEDDKALYDRARKEARKGRAAAEKFWKALGASDRARLRPIVDEIGKLAAEADAAAAEEENPFAAPPDDDAPAYDPTDEEKAHEAFERERAEREKETA